MQETLSQILTLAIATVAAAAQRGDDAVRINEVSDRGTSSGPCENDKDWTELHLPDEASAPVDLAGYILYDDMGSGDIDAYTFPVGYTIQPGQYAVVCHRGDDPNTSPQFGIGVTDTLTLLDTTGAVVSSTGPLGGIGARDTTLAYDDATSTYVYTSTPTPGEANELTEYIPETVEEMRARLIAQNDEGTDFFNMDGSGFEVEGGMPDLLDLRIEMDPDERQKMHYERSYETYSDFLSATVTSTGNPDEVILSLPSGGRMRPRGQSTLVFGTCMDRSVPYTIDFDRGTDPDQTLFGVKRAYLRTHVLDGSFSREWVMHRMLARFGLPHLRARSVRVFINGVLEGLYTMLEATDQEYVYQRSFPNFDRDRYGLYKVKTLSLGCGQYDDGTVLGPARESLTASALARLNETATPPYRFERGDHRPLLPVMKDNWVGCVGAFGSTLEGEFADVVLAYTRKNATCGEFLVDQGLIDRDLGPEAMDGVMMDFVNKHLGPNKCDIGCENSDLPMDVDTTQVLRNMAVMAAMLHIDSPLVNGNNYYLAFNDGLWSMVQYDHNNMMDPAVSGLLCSAECSEDAIKWSILRPTCKNIESNQLVGPMLSEESLRNEYVEYVREFVDVVMTNETFQGQIRDHIVAIEQAAKADPWSDVIAFFEHELKDEDGDEWQVAVPPPFPGAPAEAYSPLLPAIRARAAEVQKQLEAIDTKSLPRDTDDIDEAEVCVAWDAEVARESDAGCADNCLYDGCFREDFEVPGFCEPMTQRCVHGKVDPQCEGVMDTQGYSGITPFEGSDQIPYCWTDPTLGSLKMAYCPAKASSSAGCELDDDCLYEGCYREGFDIPALCDPITNSCMHGLVDSQCEGVPPAQGYDGITNFEGSNQLPFCWTDPTIGALKIAFCPAETDIEGVNEIVTTTETTVTTITAAPIGNESTTAPDNKGDGNDVGVDTQDSGSAGIFAGAMLVQLYVLVVLSIV